MRRSRKFPYTARSSARVIRHAVAIDERRAKFRSDLVSQVKEAATQHHHRHHFRHPRDLVEGIKDFDRPISPRPTSPRASTDIQHAEHTTEHRPTGRSPRRASVMLSAVAPSSTHPERFRSRSRSRRSRSMSRPRTGDDSNSYCSAQAVDDEYETTRQDIEEIWFSGGHADIGGGWAPDEVDCEEVSLSHIPLTWMVREARKAGLNFDEEKMKSYGCYYDPEDGAKIPPIPEIEVNGTIEEQKVEGDDYAEADAAAVYPDFHETMHRSTTRSRMHDCLAFHHGVPNGTVLSWKLMEYLPFRRMDLQSDGTWKSIRWPLPMGETRDIPNNSKIHTSVIRRMKANEEYRPGNLIVGGGGRGMRKAPKDMGTGSWKVLREEGDLIGETYVRAEVVGSAK